MARDNNPAGWQPIATAPRDGTDVLVSNGTAVWKSFYDEDGWEPECVWGDVCPTHWQPLPAPPLPAPPEVTPAPDGWDDGSNVR